MNDLAKWLRCSVARQDPTNQLLSMAMFVAVAIAASQSDAAPAPLGCDFNSNGVCDAADYTLWRNHLGDSTEAGINFGGDGGGVGQSDYASWKDGFGEFAGSGAIAATGGVPEPATGVLAALAMLMFAWHRSRR